MGGRLDRVSDSATISHKSVGVPVYRDSVAPCPMLKCVPVYRKLPSTVGN